MKLVELFKEPEVIVEAQFSDDEIAATMAAFDDCYEHSTGSREEFMAITEEYAS